MTTKWNGKTVDIVFIPENLTPLSEYYINLRLSGKSDKTTMDIIKCLNESILYKEENDMSKTVPINEPDKNENQLEEILEKLFYANNSAESEGTQADIDEAKQAINDYIKQLTKEAYRDGYNDNARICECNMLTIAPHMHLLDDGKSHKIVPDIQREEQKKDK